MCVRRRSYVSVIGVVSETVAAQDPPFVLAGVMLSLLAIVCASTVRIMVPGGLDGYWQQKIQDFEKMKKEQGEDVTVLMDPVDSTIHFESVQNEISAGLDLTDGFVIMASWLPDFLEGLKDLTDMVKERVDMNWNDVLPFVRDKLCSYDQRVYLVPVDLDMMYVHYREDLRVDASLPVPNTWEKVLEFAKHYHNTDLNGDGTPDFGLCFPTMEGGYATWNFMTVETPYMQTQGTTGGAWFDKSSMDTLLSGEGFAEAMRTYAETLKFTQNVDGLPRSAGEHASDGISLMGSVLPNQVSGRCALIYDWMASGTSSVLEGPWFGTSYVNNQVRSTLVPEGAGASQEELSFFWCDLCASPVAPVDRQRAVLPSGRRSRTAPWVASLPYFALLSLASVALPVGSCVGIIDKRDADWYFASAVHWLEGLE